MTVKLQDIYVGSGEFGPCDLILMLALESSRSSRLFGDPPVYERITLTTAQVEKLAAELEKYLVLQQALKEQHGQT